MAVIDSDGIRYVDNTDYVPEAENPFSKPDEVTVDVQ
jgi:hypothetical protein